MSVAEKYIRATRSSHLEVDDEPGDIDSIIAAGMVREESRELVGRKLTDAQKAARPSMERLGVMLFRLRSEFDGVMSEHRAAEAEFQRQHDRAKEEAASAPVGPTRQAEILQAAEAAALTTRALIMVQLQSLEPVARAVGNYAVLCADIGAHTRRRHPLRRAEDTLRKLAGRVMDVFLDGTCPICDGRGFTGGYKAPQVFCAHCKATGKRLATFSNDAEEHDFARWLLDDLSGKMHAAGQQMRAKLKN